MQTPLTQIALGQVLGTPVAVYQGQQISRADFCRDVAGKAGALVRQPQTEYALFYEEAYPFTVMLFALWHAGKAVWIAANNKPANAEKLRQQGCALLGDWPSGEPLSLLGSAGSPVLSALDLQGTRITLFTSGSTGQPQAIQKQLWQLQAEVDALEQQWGKAVANAQVLATVSHQHIYGLLFKVLWPLASGRCFYSQIYLNPESLLKAALKTSQPSCWVASPAQLKRLDELTPWQDIRSLRAIFSSGGSLGEDAIGLIKEQGAGPKLIDIYGSSETGGIAWREPIYDGYWQAFPGIRITSSAGQQHRLQSPYLPKGTSYVLQDKIEFCKDGRFSLLGRSDRIVKIEEKRLSLTEMEQALLKSGWVGQAHCRLWGNQRERVACALMLTSLGLDHFKRYGRADLIKALTTQLSDSFERVALPKKWLFMDCWPLSSQGKSDADTINGLLDMDGGIFPELQFFGGQDDGVELVLRMQAGLPYFAGHFPKQPILPGVTQLAWAESYGKLFFPISQPFSGMEVIKFKKIIRPGDKLTLQLKWNAGSGKLYFDFSSAIESHSSGRLLYGDDK